MKYYVYTTEEGSLLFVEHPWPEKQCLGIIKADKDTIQNLRRVEGATYAFLRGVRNIIRGG